MSKSKKPDSKKCGKGNKSSAVAAQEKPVKVRGSIPASYAPKKQTAVLEAPQTDPIIIWNGWGGIVEIQGMRFRSSKKKVDNGAHYSLQVFVLSAPAGTELYGLAGSSIYLTVPQMRSLDFRSSMKEGSVDHKRQERLWNFFNKLFIGLGVKQSHAQRVKPKHEHAKARPHDGNQNSKVSSSVDDLVSGVPGIYSFEKEGEPRAYFQGKIMPYKSKVTSETRQALVVEAVSINPGHELYDYVRTYPRKPFIFHDQLSWGGVPNFKGEYAGAQLKIWEYLTDLIAAHRKNVLGGETGIVNPDYHAPEGKVIYLADRQKAA